jgi:hypothetical protein
MPIAGMTLSEGYLPKERAPTRDMRGCGAHGVHQLMRAEQAFCAAAALGSLLQ